MNTIMMIGSGLEDTVGVDTTGGTLTFHLSTAKFQEIQQYTKNRPLSAKVDLSSLELSPATQAQLDSIFAGPSFPISLGAAERYDLAKQKLQGRVLYWFLAGELRTGIRFGNEAYVDARWKSFGLWRIV